MGIEPDAEIERRAFGGGIAPCACVGPHSGMTCGRNIILNALDLRHRVVREVMRPRHEIIAFDTGATHRRMSRHCGEDALLALSALRRRRSGQDARRRSHQGPLCAARPGADGGGFAAGGAQTGLRPRNRPAGKIAPIVSRTETAFRHRRGRIRRHGRHRDARKRARRACRPDSGRVRPGKTGAGRASGENVWEASGALPLHELEKIIGEIAARGGVATASGWITRKLGGFPKAGDIIDGRRVRIAGGGNGRPARGRVSKSPDGQAESGRQRT